MNGTYSAESGRNIVVCVSLMAHTQTSYDCLTRTGIYCSSAGKVPVSKLSFTPSSSATSTAHQTRVSGELSGQDDSESERDTCNQPCVSATYVEDLSDCSSLQGLMDRQVQYMQQVSIMY